MKGRILLKRVQRALQIIPNARVVVRKNPIPPLRRLSRKFYSDRKFIAHGLDGSHIKYVLDMHKTGVPVRAIVSLLWLLCLALMYLLACTAPSNEEMYVQRLQAIHKKFGLSIMSFNVQNLFDGEKKGNEYEEFSPPRWTPSRYQTRLKLLGDAISSLGTVPDIVVLQEVENYTIALELQKYYLPRHSNIATTENSYSATQVIVLSTYPFLRVRSHGVLSEFAKSTRHILEINVDISSIRTNNVDDFQLIALHLKSKRETKGAYSAAHIRDLQIQLIDKNLTQSKASLIVGDFNDNIDLSVFSHKVYESKLQSIHPEVRGTYFFRKVWDHIDHIYYNDIMNMMLIDKEYYVLDIVPFISYTSEGVIPHSFELKYKKSRGISDHLPVLMFFKFKH